jgi:hypothetical protein
MTEPTAPRPRRAPQPSRLDPADRPAEAELARARKQAQRPWSRVVRSR